MKKISLYTDGGSRSNPGPAATGVVIKDEAGSILSTSTKYLGKATNNVAEYQALLEGLIKVNKDYGRVLVVAHLDSELIVKQMVGEYKVKDEELKKLYDQVLEIVSKLAGVEFKHIRREKNSEADALVNQTLDRKA